MKPGDKIYYLLDYNLMPGIIISIGRKNIKIKHQPYYGSNWFEKYVPFDKVVGENDMVCVVWEQWKGKNGRGGYRLERELYKDKQRLAKNYPHQALVWEDEYGVQSDFKDHRFIR